ncbi:MAG: zf-HC2 domain-containing protein [Candidatus Eisenbacteria bacterium]|nr:zf-HC2 domain-containing protein [Candidatus Eisenbacteria bacterium]
MMTADDRDQACAAIEGLLVWYPTSTLTADERARVEDHVAGCGPCADLLRFAASLKDRLAEASSMHPAPELLVRFVEQSDDLPLTERALVETHIAGCAECMRESEILRAVDRDLAPAGERSESKTGRASGLSLAGTRFRGLWEALAGTLLRPVPAAVYLTATAALALVLLSGVDRPSERFPGTHAPPADAAPRGLVDGVVLLPSDLGAVRGPQGVDDDAPSVDTSCDQFLLLELTDLEAPPRSGTLYDVAITRAGGSSPEWTGQVDGLAFAENYSVCILLEAGSLRPGDYVVTLATPSGDLLYRSTMAAR